MGNNEIRKKQLIKDLTECLDKENVKIVHTSLDNDFEVIRNPITGHVESILTGKKTITIKFEELTR